MLVNNNSNIEALVEKFNKFQVQEGKGKGKAGYLRKLGKTVKKFVHRSEYKNLKTQLTKQLYDLQFIKYDGESIHDRKKPAKTNDILNAIEQYQKGLKVHQDIKEPSKIPSVNYTSSFGDDNLVDDNVIDKSSEVEQQVDGVVDKKMVNPESLSVQNEKSQVKVNEIDEQVFLENLSLWESKGSGKEQRGEAASRIRQAFTDKAGSLNISNLNLSEFPEAVFDIISLKKLEIDHNNFKCLPEGFDRLSNLETLTCYDLKIAKIAESLICHPNEQLTCKGFSSKLSWFGLRENYCNRDNILIQTYRNRHANEDDTVSIEQGPINLSPKAMNERGFWVYNEEPQTVTEV